MIRLFARILSARPALALGTAVILTIVLAAGLPWIGFDMHPNATFAADNEASRNLDRLHSIFGPDDNDVVVMVEGDGLLEGRQLEALRTFRDQIRSIKNVKFVASIFDLTKPQRAMPLIPTLIGDRFDADQLQNELQRNPISAEQLISEDGRFLTMLVRVEGASLAVSEAAQVMTALQKFAAEYEAATNAKVRLAGHPAIRVDVITTLRRSMLAGCTAAVAIGFVISLLVFRHLPSVIIAVVPPAVGTVWTMGLLAWNQVPVSGLLTALPNLVFVIGLTDAVHLLLEAQRELHRGQSQRQSAYDALRRVGPACFLTSLTTFLGFGSLALSRTDSVREFGLWAAIGTTCAMLAVVVVLPTILMTIPRTWATNDRTSRDGLGNLIMRMVGPTLNRPRLTTILATVTCLALLYPALNQRPDIMWTETMPYDSSSVLAMNQADRQFGGAMLAHMMIQWPEGRAFPDRQTLLAAADIHALFNKHAGFSGPFSIRNVLATVPGNDLQERYQLLRSRANDTSQMLISEPDRTLLVSARVPNDGSHALGQRLDELQQDLNLLRQKYPDFKFTLTGTAVAAAENMSAIIVDLVRSLMIAAVLIVFVLAVAFRSIKIGLLTVVPNALPLLITAAGLTLLGMPLQITAALTFSLCLGLAVDDTIHVLVRYQMNRDLHPDNTRLAIEQTVHHVGPALLVTTAILLAGFIAMLVSPMPGIRLFALLSSVTLISALIGDLLFFPAILLWGLKRKLPEA